ncbi:MAG TPA: SRPBCC domain-containing protein [Chloroflexota bacterium]|jgi:uncharacterized protein YndB with AHSA1/START domain|nr:SRPBCC domain-containing protein [Chloroflexota bacterium]
MSISEINAVVSEVRIAAPPETVFAYFIDPAKMTRWMGSRVELEPKSGGTFAVDLNAEARGRGTFLEVVPPSRVVFTFGWEHDQAVPPGSSTVEVTLTPDGDGTHVRLVHRGLMTAETREQHQQGWQHYLDRLAIAAAGGDAGLDPNANPPQEHAH